PRSARGAYHPAARECFSASGVFLSALKGLPNATLPGTPSAGVLRRSSSAAPRKRAIDRRVGWHPVCLFL
ncbi:MAG TPA: hypothetical protein VIL46_02165, partial [Gemmataceae bacterium]